MSDWIEWSGGECPVPQETLVQVRTYNCGELPPARAGMLVWAHFDRSADVIAYRVINDTTNTPSPLDKQVAGDHYKKLKIQPIEYIHANGLPFAEGSVVKYVSRWRDKGGIKDLEKAKHFIELLIELEQRNG